MIRLFLILVMMMSLSPGMQAQTDPYTQALKNGNQAQEAFIRCRDFVRGWLAHRDPQSGLIPRNLTDSPFWNAKDAAADNYPFMVLTTALTDPLTFRTTMHEILDAEQRLTNRIDALPDDFLFATQTFRTKTAHLPDLIFGGSEYVKDGLIPLTEWLGESPWSYRMLAILDSIWAHAEIETPFGKIPSDSHEINGEQMQTLCRIYWMTRDTRYKDWAFRLADYYFQDHLPTEGKELRLRDHGCEVISGLSEAYLLSFYTDPARYPRYRPRIHCLLDTLLAKGTNSDGMFYDVVNPQTGDVLRDEISDNWGYNYNAFYTVSMIDNEPRFRDAVATVLSNISDYKDYSWERGSSDGYADAIEGALNLLNRVSVDSAFDWVEHSTRIMFSKQQADGVIEGWHGDGNFARTAIMYALWKTQGTHIEPWRADIRFGATKDNDTLYLALQSAWDWQGSLLFDCPRHREILGLPIDYPRINQFPEWFTVESERIYWVTLNQEKSIEVSGERLRNGFPILLKKNQVTHIEIR